MRAHPVRLGAHRESEGAGRHDVGIGGEIQHAFAGLGAPDEPI